MYDLCFEYMPQDVGPSRLLLQPDYSKSPHSLWVGIREADRLLSPGHNCQGRLNDVLNIGWDASSAMVVRWIKAMQEHGHSLSRMIGISKFDKVPLVSGMGTYSAWDEWFERPYRKLAASRAAHGDRRRSRRRR